MLRIVPGYPQPATLSVCSSAASKAEDASPGKTPVRIVVAYAGGGLADYRAADGRDVLRSPIGAIFFLTITPLKSPELKHHALKGEHCHRDGSGSRHRPGNLPA